VGSTYLDSANLNEGGCSTPAYLLRTYLGSIPVYFSPVSGAKRRVEVLGCVESTELLCNRNNKNGGLLIYMSLVRVQPGEPDFSMFFQIPTATDLRV